MKRDRVFESTAARAGDFAFDAEVAEVFDDMLLRSIPSYAEQQHMIREIAAKFWVEDTQLVDLGCSTATTLIGLSRALPSAATLVGYDNSEPMLERARQNVSDNDLDDRVDLRLADLNGDLSRIELRDTSVVTLCWTLQRVLEMTDDSYTRRFGGARVQRSDVLHYVPGNPHATIVADLTGKSDIPADAFDCIICTQTLQFIYEPLVALHELHRILKPGGVLLLTGHGTSRIARREGVDPWGEYWRFTTQALNRMLDEAFPGGDVSVETFGNVLTAVAGLHGLAAQELHPEELDFRDENYEVLVAARAKKADR